MIEYSTNLIQQTDNNIEKHGSLVGLVQHYNTIPRKQRVSHHLPYQDTYTPIPNYATIETFYDRAIILVAFSRGATMKQAKTHVLRSTGIKAYLYRLSQIRMGRSGTTCTSLSPTHKSTKQSRLTQHELLLSSLVPINISTNSPKSIRPSTNKRLKQDEEQKPSPRCIPIQSK